MASRQRHRQGAGAMFNLYQLQNSCEARGDKARELIAERDQLQHAPPAANLDPTRPGPGELQNIEEMITARADIVEAEASRLRERQQSGWREVAQRAVTRSRAGSWNLLEVTDARRTAEELNGITITRTDREATFRPDAFTSLEEMQALMDDKASQQWTMSQVWQQLRLVTSQLQRRKEEVDTERQTLMSQNERLLRGKDELLSSQSKTHSEELTRLRESHDRALEQQRSTMIVDRERAVKDAVSATAAARDRALSDAASWKSQLDSASAREAALQERINSQSARVSQGDREKNAQISSLEMHALQSIEDKKLLRDLFNKAQRERDDAQKQSAELQTKVNNGTRFASQLQCTIDDNQTTISQLREELDVANKRVSAAEEENNDLVVSLAGDEWQFNNDNRRRADQLQTKCHTAAFSFKMAVQARNRDLQLLHASQSEAQAATTEVARLKEYNSDSQQRAHEFHAKFSASTASHEMAVEAHSKDLQLLRASQLEARNATADVARLRSSLANASSMNTALMSGVRPVLINAIEGTTVDVHLTSQEVIAATKSISGLDIAFDPNPLTLPLPRNALNWDLSTRDGAKLSEDALRDRNGAPRKLWLLACLNPSNSPTALDLAERTRQILCVREGPADATTGVYIIAACKLFAKHFVDRLQSGEPVAIGMKEHALLIAVCIELVVRLKAHISVQEVLDMLQHLAAFFNGFATPRSDPVLHALLSWLHTAIQNPQAAVSLVEVVLTTDQLSDGPTTPDPALSDRANRRVLLAGDSSVIVVNPALMTVHEYHESELSLQHTDVWLEKRIVFRVQRRIHERYLTDHQLCMAETLEAREWIRDHLPSANRESLEEAMGLLDLPPRSPEPAR